MKPATRLATCCNLLVFTLSAQAVSPTAGEFLAARSWLSHAEAGSEQYLEITYEDVAEGLTRGRSWRGTPYQLGEKTYRHGIAFNATKHLVVHLGQPARRFTAEIGLENNDDTRRGEALGNGSVTFHVLAGGKEVFTSPVRRRKDGPLALDVSLEGVREFELRVGDGGDGRGWDQALWAEAVVTLQDGATVRLQDLPLARSGSASPGLLSFRYGDRDSATLLQTWRRSTAERKLDSQQTRRELSWEDPESGLRIRVEATLFNDFPAVEWVVYFTNSAATNTPILENISALDSLLPVPVATEGVLHWSRGAVASFDDFAPQTATLKAGAKQVLRSGEGRSSSQVLPFFNLEGANGGAVAALGWSGTWVAEFVTDGWRQVRMKAGLELTHLVLKPGESIRTPRMLLLVYEGDRWRGQNLLRQFLLAHHRPRLNGQPLIAPVTCGNWGGTRAEVHLDNIRRIARQALPIAYYWIDAEWYGHGSWPVNVGNWQVKQDLYPAGFKPLSTELRASGRELMLWFEPERVYKGTPWHQEHRDWLLDTGGDSLLFNLGNTAARKFLTDFISGRVDEFGLGCYRQDFNMDPRPYWRAADAPDRQGITEIRHIEGLYAFWDELLARHPGLMIDNCASGGRRIDLETVGRATPFWRTDGPRDAIAHQCHTYGLLPWVPLSATSQDRASDDYEFRSSMCSGLCLNWWVSGDVPAERIPADFPFPWARATLERYLEFRQYYYGDFYPLTSYSQDRGLWMAYQLDRPDLGKGMVVALRRPLSPYDSARFPLAGLDPAATYQLTDLDTHTQTQRRGDELAQDGLPLALKARPGSAVILYERQ